MSAAASGGGFILTLSDQQQLPMNDVTTAQPQHASITPSLSSSSQHCHISTVLSPTVGQLVLCPASTPSQQQFAYHQSAAPLTIAAAAASAAQLCTVLGPMVTSVPLLQVPAVVQSVQLMPAAVGVPVSPVFVAGDVTAPSPFFMVPN